jgi:CheY-like chemotaxis protein
MTQAPKILVVDDDPDLREVLRIVLVDKGYSVVLAENGPKGLEIADRERPDLLLLDVMMPEGTEGFHVVWKLRNLSDPYFQGVPIIILTAIHQQTALRFYPDSGDGTYEAGEFLPVQGFVDKPIEPQVLVKEIERVLSLAQES